jgi:hypothetical protein
MLEDSQRDTIVMSDIVQGEFYVQVGEIQDTMTDERRSEQSRPIRQTMGHGFGVGTPQRQVSHMATSCRRSVLGPRHSLLSHWSGSPSIDFSVLTNHSPVCLGTLVSARRSSGLVVKSLTRGERSCTVKRSGGLILVCFAPVGTIPSFSNLLGRQRPSTSSSEGLKF